MEVSQEQHHPLPKDRFGHRMYEAMAKTGVARINLCRILLFLLLLLLINCNEPALVLAIFLEQNFVIRTTLTSPWTPRPKH